MGIAIALILAGYLLGAIPFGYLVARKKGIDILRQGSCNIGATNVGRVLGRKLGILVFLLDFAKGAVPVLAARLMPIELDWPPDSLAVCTGVAAFLGHMFPIYLRFRGGKGVATGAGIVAVLLPLPLLATLLVWLAVVLATRYISLASVLAVLFLAGQRLAFTPEPWGPEHRVITLFCLLAAILVVARHQANLRRLWAGNENQVKESSAMLNLSKSLHILALGTCLGAQVFFTIQGVVTVRTFEDLSRPDKEKREPWFPLPDRYGKKLSEDAAKVLAKEHFSDGRMEQGSRGFGAVVSPLFAWYYGLQTGCVLLAIACAWSWPKLAPDQRVHRVRRALLIVAVVLLGIGWWLDFVVHDLRVPRNEKTDIVLRSAEPNSQQIKEAKEARSAFFLWHTFSLAQNFATLIVVAWALALAARMPETGQTPSANT